MMKNCKDTDITGTLKTALIEQYVKCGLFG